MEALGSTGVGVAGLGLWGSNLARNFHELARLAWICDTDEERLAAAAARYPAACATTSFDELLADGSVKAVVVSGSRQAWIYPRLLRRPDFRPGQIVNRPPATRC